MLAVLPIVAGLAWLGAAARFGPLAFALAALPGSLLLASGVSILLWPGDRRIASFAALGGLVGVIAGPLAGLVAGPGPALLWTALSLAAGLSAGAVSIRWEPRIPEVPPPEPSLDLVAKVAADEVVLAGTLTVMPMVSATAWDRIRGELRRARELFAAEGWLDAPVRFHGDPPPLEKPSLESRRVGGRSFEHVRFESGYEPHAGEPGRERWLSYGPNRTAHAWLIRHPGPPRPWLVLIHGFMMGSPRSDFAIFDPDRFGRELGLNLIYPVLPFHGPRQVGRVSGAGFLSGDVLDVVHAEAQAMWDIRRLLGWVRAQGAPAIGVYGVSLGGYQTALLTGLEPDLACAIAGIPLTDIARTLWRHGPDLLIRRGEDLGVRRRDVDEVLSVVSPLSLPPRIRRERRFVYGATADRLVSPDQVRDLWEHWEQPRHLWYNGSHVSFRIETAVHGLVHQALDASGLTSGAPLR